MTEQDYWPAFAACSRLSRSNAAFNIFMNCFFSIITSPYSTSPIIIILAHFIFKIKHSLYHFPKPRNILKVIRVCIA